MADITITMIGGKGSGKTTYLAAMYDDMRHGYGGFSFSAVDPDIDIQLADAWEDIEKTGVARKWPAPTDESAEFDFDMLYAFERFMTFKWVDYPGDSIVTRKRNEISEELVRYLKGSSCIYIVAPGEFLFDVGQSGRRVAEKAMFVSDVGRLMKEVINSLPADKKPSLVILVTKFDKFKSSFNKMQDSDQPWTGTIVDGCRPREYGTKIQDYLEYCVSEAYSQVCAPDGGLNTMICTVTLGNGLADDIAGGAIAPEWVHAPVLFAYLEYVSRLESDYRKIQYEVQNNRRDMASNMLKRWINEDEIASLDSQLKSLQERLNQYQSRLKIVKQAMPTDMIIFRNGRKGNQ